MPLPNFDINKFLPGFGKNTAVASQNIGQQLNGMPSTAPARAKAAYFGATSGMPNSGVSNFAGYDLYGQDAEKQKQMGLDNLLKMLTSYSGNAFATPGQDIQSGQFDQELAFKKSESDAANELAQEELAMRGKSQRPRSGYIQGPSVPQLGNADWWLDQQNRRYA